MRCGRAGPTRAVALVGVLVKWRPEDGIAIVLIFVFILFYAFITLVSPGAR
jgi:hypothetical protein